MAMAAYCSSEDYNGFLIFFIVQAQEEYTHAMKFFDLLMTWVEESQHWQWKNQK